MDDNEYNERVLKRLEKSIENIEKEFSGWRAELNEFKITTITTLAVYDTKLKLYATLSAVVVGGFIKLIEKIV